MTIMSAPSLLALVGYCRHPGNPLSSKATVLDTPKKKLAQACQGEHVFDELFGLRYHRPVS
jgi:hypothetical protein